MSREVGNWLQGYIQYTAESESPDQYHLWTGLSVLASVVRRNIWLSQGFFQVIPNLYVILVGPPAKTAKSTAIRLGRRLLLSVEEIVFGPDSVTREQLIRELAAAGIKQNSSAITLHSTELSSLIEPSGITMVQFLTDIFDGDDSWRYSTKGQGKDDIKFPVVNILAGTTPSWIAEGMPENITSHGFTSRVVFVFADEPRFLNPRPGEPPAELTEALKRDLQSIATLRGEMTLSPEADAKYDFYYRKVYDSAPADYRTEGYYWRKAKVHLLKTAMLLAIAENDSMIVSERDLDTAWDLLQEIEPQMHQTFSAVGKYQYASDLDRIIEQIARVKEGLPTSRIMSMNYAVGDMATIQNILNMIVQMGRATRTMERGEMVYHAPQKKKKGG